LMVIILKNHLKVMKDKMYWIIVKTLSTILVYFYYLVGQS